MHLIRRMTWKESGQILALYALVLPLLFLFMGFGIDFGFGFLSKAQLAKACDAASLAVMRNLGRGQTQAKAIGQSVFALNTNSKFYSSAPSATINITTGANGEPIVNVAASATFRTYFIAIAGFRTLTIGSSSQATRPPIVLSLVLDRSGSMNLNGGAQALPPAVQNFLGYFIDGTDELGEVSFSSTATPDVAISQSFQSAIQNSVSGMTFGGATFAQGGLTDANAQVTGVSPLPAQAVQVVVFFTDGWANSVQATVAGSQVNFGGCAPAEFTNSPQWCNGVSCWNAASGRSIGGTVVPSVTTPVTCDGVNTFTSTDPAIPTNPASLTIQNIATEADYRAVQLANAMRAQGITVYSIGLGDKINATYLEELANDPSSPTYDPSQPSGLFEDAPSSADLERAFQTVASKIILRLTQ